MAEPIRVLQYGMSANRGGIESSVMNIYRNIDRTSVQFDFIAFNNNIAFMDEILAMGGKIHLVTPRRKDPIACSREMDRLLMANHFAAVHVHVCTLSHIHLLELAYRRQVPLRIIHSRSSNNTGGFIPRVLHWYNKRRLRYATSLLACSTEAGKWLFGTNPLQSVQLVKNGINVKQYVFNQHVRENVRRELGLDDQFVIGHIGVFNSVKNHPYLIEVFTEIRKRIPQAKLVLVGDGPLRAEVETLVASLQLSNAVLFTGMRTDIHALVQGMDLLIFPSLFEGLPRTLIEAQASGLRVIASDMITPEVQITELLDFMSLKDSAEHWAEAACAFAQGYERRNMTEKIVRQGYDITDSAKWLEKLYISG